jgi:hypothetical protein
MKSSDKSESRGEVVGGLKRDEKVSKCHVREEKRGLTRQIK